MSISGEMDKLIAVLDEKLNASAMRREAIVAGNPARARYIELYVLPGFKDRILRQISTVNETFKKYGRTQNETQQAN